MSQHGFPKFSKIYLSMVHDYIAFSRMYEMIEGRNSDDEIRNTQDGKSAGVDDWLKMPLFGYTIANHLRRPL
ncbi:hypothetical protein BY996DRAFT_6621773 [Phakopsora pachyrhizi]|nr:hypothetical protein BY996DRAFT_6621773 [Phakopsora pachyrhizi]